MPTIHFLNVKEGDCSVIEHSSGRVSVIDVCNAKPSDSLTSKAEMVLARSTLPSASGNFRQKEHPVNPVDHLREHGIKSIFRFILTHPDMDHMGGIKALFKEFPPVAFWDTNNQKEISGSSWEGSPYDQADWAFYKALRDNNPQSNRLRKNGFYGQAYLIRGGREVLGWAGMPVWESGITAQGVI